MKMQLETELFNLVVSNFSKLDTKEVVLGVSGLDDAAVVDCGINTQLVIATDFVRGSEFYLFQLGYLNYFDVGYYLAAANISDMAAMGCAPTGLLSVVRYSKNMTTEMFEEVLKGIAAAAAKYSCSVVGGDSGGYIADVFSATAFAIIEKNRFLKRSSAKDGDILCISGPIGGGIGALTYFKELKGDKITLSQDEEDSLIRFWKRPQARVDIGTFLVNNCIEAACMDNSDGLKASVEQLSSSSEIGFRLSEELIPVVPVVEKIAGIIGVDVVTFASSASVDFELLFTVPKEKFDSLKILAKEQGLDIFNIGVAGNDFKNDIVCKDGTVKPFSGVAWKHQEGDHLKEILEKSKK